jgi:tRNA pseudouridine38-40 synthase
MYNYRLTIAYNGSLYHGWQINPGKITIQQVLEEALAKAHNGCPIKIKGASRTDAGVHSYGQTCNFSHGKLWNPTVLQKATNFYLKNTQIVVTKVAIVPEDFHSRYGSQGKVYQYQIVLDDIIDPFQRGYWWHWPKTVDENKLKTAIDALKNSKSLNGFAHWNQPLKNHYTLQDIAYLLENNKLILTFQGKGFFYNEIRFLVGHIIYYSTNLMDEATFWKPLNVNWDNGATTMEAVEEKTPDDPWDPWITNNNLEFENQKTHQNNHYKKILAPAHGLFLMEVFY